ncbi:sensor histidine kinase [Kordia algicida OT-1]|uniref:histidine kinase n=1 Tax=Kordia algicida OT-1 TaxID=391587 RepID=A9DKJ0_9FLAO|nr:sensor histidine kinase [Kordia algicida]EDP98336.1 Signal Transduction Histidine Kinase [Kordia algicida OT-1]
MNRFSISIKSFKSYLFIVAFSAIFCVSAQVPSIQKKYDSIAKILEQTKNKDSIFNLLNLQKELAEKAENKAQLIALHIKLAALADRGSVAQMEYLETALSLANEQNDTASIITASVKLARVFQVRNDYNKALFHVNTSIELSEETEDKNAIIEAYATRGNIYNNISQIAAAISDLNVAKKIALQLPDNEKELIPILKTASYIHYSNNQYTEGLQILDEIIAFYNEKGDDRKKSIWRNNKAMIHLSCLCVPVEIQKQNLYKSIKSAKKINFNAGEAYAYVHLARMLKNENKLDSAYIYLEKASNIQLGRSTKRFQGYLNQIKGDFWATKENASQAIKYFEKAYNIWDELNVLKDKQYTAKALAHFYDKQRNSAKAYKYMETYATIKDSAFSKQKVEQIKEIELTYEFKKQQYKDSIQNAEAIDIMALEQQNEIQREKHLQQILFGLFLVALAFGGFAYYAYNRKKKTSKLLDEKNKIIEKALQEKQLLLKEVHHRVKNNFQIVSSLLELQTKGIEDEKALSLANEGKNRVKSMALIHQKLYQNETGLIDFDEYIQTLVKELSYMYASEKKVTTNIHTENMEFDIDTAIPLGLIVNELITNAYKYAFDATKNNELNISINKVNDEEYKLVVSDNGKGLDDTIDLTKVKSLGLRLVRRLTKQLQGKFQLNNEDGASFEITFKDTQKRALLD